MVFDKKTWVDRQSQYPNRRALIDVLSGTTQMVDVVRSEGTVTVAGHPLNASNLNDLEDRIEDAVDTLQENFLAGVDSIYDACVDKGSTPASHSLADILQAIENISGGGSANMFGTPDSDTPEVGTITVECGVEREGHEAYKAFGNNDAGWISGASGLIQFDSLIYQFTNGLAYQPAQLRFCNNFKAGGGEGFPQIKVAAGSYVFSGSNDGGTTWTEISSGSVGIGQEGNIVTVDIDGSNEYYSAFKLYFTGPDVSYGGYLGVKNLVCYGYVKSGSNYLPSVLHPNYVFRPQHDADVALPANSGKYYLYLLGASYSSSYLPEPDLEATNASLSELFSLATVGEMAPSYAMKMFLLTKIDDALISTPDCTAEDYSGFFALAGNPTFGQFTLNNNVLSNEHTQTIEFTTPYLLVVVGIRTADTFELNYSTVRLLSSDKPVELCGWADYGNIDRSYLFAQVFAVHNDGSNSATINLCEEVSTSIERLTLAYAPMTITQT